MRKIVIGMMLLAAAAAARAETLRVWVLYPASSDAAASLQSIKVEPFGGDVGSDLSLKIEDVLRGIDLGDGPYFRIVPAGTSADAEAVLRGTAYSEQRFQEYTETRERCVRDASGNCTAVKEKVIVRCRRRHIELVVAMRLVARDGTLLWSDDRPEGYDDSSCEDNDTSPRARSAVARDLAGRVAQRLVSAFAPRRTAENIRVDEDRKGLNKPDSELFKTAVKATKRDWNEACGIWRDLAVRNLGHAPTMFNVGLCAEAGYPDKTPPRTYYRQVLTINPKHKYARQGLERLAGADRAQRQLQAHNAD